MNCLPSRQKEEIDGSSDLISEDKSTTSCFTSSRGSSKRSSLETPCPEDIELRVYNMARTCSALKSQFEAGVKNVACSLVGHLVANEDYVRKFVHLYFTPDWTLSQCIGAPYKGFTIMSRIMNNQALRVPETLENELQEQIVSYFVYGIIPKGESLRV